MLGVTWVSGPAGGKLPASPSFFLVGAESQNFSLSAAAAMHEFS